MAETEEYLRGKLTEIIRATPWLVEVLETVQAFGPPGAHVAAGAIRNTVWSVLHGDVGVGPAGDIDVVYFSTGADGEHGYQDALRARSPRYEWDVANQATIHRWQSSALARSVPPYSSLADAIARWAERWPLLEVILPDDTMT